MPSSVFTVSNTSGTGKKKTTQTDLLQFEERPPSIQQPSCLFDPSGESDNGGTLPRVTQCSDGSFCCDGNSGVFLAENGFLADTEASTTTSYPPVSGTGTDRYVSDPPEPSAIIMAAVEIF